MTFLSVIEGETEEVKTRKREMGIKESVGGLGRRWVGDWTVGLWDVGRRWVLGRHMGRGGSEIK